MQTRTILNSKQFGLTIDRLCYQLIENHNDFTGSAIIGLQPRGIYVMKRIRERLGQIGQYPELQFGELDITFYRDDFRRRETPLAANATQIDFLIENKRVVLIDDVLYTGRTIRAGLDALMDYGRPEKVELLALIDRRFSRDFPIQPDYVGKTIDSIASERVRVEWIETEGQDQVILYTTDAGNE